jgi:hypothetical protein
MNVIYKSGSSTYFMVKPLTLSSNDPLKTMKALFCNDLKLSSNKLLVLGSIKETGSSGVVVISLYYKFSKEFYGKLFRLQTQ